ncbi:N-formylglutamate amidohydrolase [Oceanibacterium hippocampi]|uniref:N-formylglutamate amidohydrolase n=1 Tax=Oceanibacterium hippocampi TaxID=745714 RepID=UPI001C38FE34|nr:N-formylglutamate amidohydrolase [Oceanibacterium hippocampi]
MSDAAFESVNEDGASDIILICDHASRAVPADLADLGLETDLLWRHIAWDIGAADVARRLAGYLDAPAMLSCFSRLVIDPNRFLDDPSSIPEVSDGIEVPGNAGLDRAAREDRAARFFRPYHEAVSAMRSRVMARTKLPALVSVHSFTPVMDGFERPWHVGVLWDQDDRIAAPLLRHLRAESGLVIGDNQPYSARQPFGYSTETHAVAHGLPHVVLEIRQDLIDTRHGAETYARLLAEAFRAILPGAIRNGDDNGARR